MDLARAYKMKIKQTFLFVLKTKVLLPICVENN